MIASTFLSELSIIPSFAPGVKEGAIGALLFVLASYIAKRQKDSTLPVLTLKEFSLGIAYLVGGALAGFVAFAIWPACPSPALYALGANFPWILNLIRHNLGPGGGEAGH